MHKKHWRLALALGVLAALPAAAPAAEPNLMGRNIGVTCFGCHGTDGKSQGVAPSLHGKKAQEIIDKMHAFRAGKDPEATIMDRIARGYTDEQIRAVADYFANLP